MARQSRQPDSTFRFRTQHQSESDRSDRRPPRNPSTDCAADWPTCAFTNAGADPAPSNCARMLRPPFIGCPSSTCWTVFTGGPTSRLSRGALFTTISPPEGLACAGRRKAAINRERSALATPSRPGKAFKKPDARFRFTKTRRASGFHVARPERTSATPPASGARRVAVSLLPRFGLSRPRDVKRVGRSLQDRHGRDISAGRLPWNSSGQTMRLAPSSLTRFESPRPTLEGRSTSKRPLQGGCRG